jgi:hypothetical protein
MTMKIQAPHHRGAQICSKQNKYHANDEFWLIVIVALASTMLEKKSMTMTS